MTLKFLDLIGAAACFAAMIALGSLGAEDPACEGRCIAAEGVR